MILLGRGTALEGSSAISPVLRVRTRRVAVFAVIDVEDRRPGLLPQPPEVLLDGAFDILAMRLFQGAAVQPGRLLSVAVTLDFPRRAGAAEGTGLVAFLVADPARPAALRAATHLTTWVDGWLAGWLADWPSPLNSLTHLLSLDGHNQKEGPEIPYGVPSKIGRSVESVGRNLTGLTD